MICATCIWFDGSRCTIKNHTVIFPNFPRRCQLYNRIPEFVANYIKQISNITNLSENDVSKSVSVKNLLRKCRLVRW